MWLRRAFSRWMAVAALALPAWVLVGWTLFNDNAWSFLWVLFIALPSVLVGSLVLMALIRSRADVRSSGAVAWDDLVVVAAWQALVVLVGFFDERFFVATLIAAIAMWLVAFWTRLVRLLRSGLNGGVVFRSAPAPAGEGDAGAGRAAGPEVIVIEESRIGASGRS